MEDWEKQEPVKGAEVITLDFDNVSEDELSDFERWLRHLTNQRRVFEVYRRKSSSRNGYHYLVHFEIPAYMIKATFGDSEEAIKRFQWAIRFLMGDDFGRLKVDAMRIEQGLKAMILFIKKNGGQVTDWELIYSSN